MCVFVFATPPPPMPPRRPLKIATQNMAAECLYILCFSAPPPPSKYLYPLLVWSVIFVIFWVLNAPPSLVNGLVFSFVGNFTRIISILHVFSTTDPTRLIWAQSIQSFHLSQSFFQIC